MGKMTKKAIKDLNLELILSESRKEVERTRPGYIEPDFVAKGPKRIFDIRALFVSREANGEN